MDEFYVPNVKYTCCACLKLSEDLLIMSEHEITLYKNYVKVEDANVVLKICYICRFMMYKLQRFVSQCQKASEFLTTVFEEEKCCLINYKPVSDYTTISTLTHYLGPHLEIEINYDHEIKPDDSDDVTKCEDIDIVDEMPENDDDIPLVMFKESVEKELDVRVEKRKRKNVTNGANNKQNVKKEPKEKKKKHLKEGFSSRMVQETNEYKVIKLTKEQVLEEMAETSKSEKYLRSVYKCEKCAKGFNFKDVLDNHMKKHSQEHGTLKCDICTQYCPSAVSLRGHMKSHTTRYKCKICGDTKISRQHLLEHYSIVHTMDASKYTCDSCPFTTKKRTVMQRHVRTHKVGKTLTCTACGAGFNNMHSLRMHASRHDPSQLFSCPQCSVKFIYPSLLHRHMRVHSQRDHYCVECDITFKSINSLKLHFQRSKRHRDPSAFKYKCTQCEDRFVSPSSVLAHLSSAHGAAKAHGCTLCGKLYSSRESAKAHERRVHSSVAVGCDACQMEFTSKHILSQHLRSHCVGKIVTCAEINDEVNLRKNAAVKIETGET